MILTVVQRPDTGTSALTDNPLRICTIISHHSKTKLDAIPCRSVCCNFVSLTYSLVLVRPAPRLGTCQAVKNLRQKAIPSIESSDILWNLNPSRRKGRWWCRGGVESRKRRSRHLCISICNPQRHDELTVLGANFLRKTR